MSGAVHLRRRRKGSITSSAWVARLNNLNKWGRNHIYMKDSYEFLDYLDKSGTFMIPKLVNLIIF